MNESTIWNAYESTKRVWLYEKGEDEKGGTPNIFGWLHLHFNMFVIIL